MSKKTVLFMEILEIIVQYSVLIPAFALIYFGAMGKPDHINVVLFFMIIPVIAAYIARKKIKKFAVFMVLHIVFAISALFIGQNETDKFFLFLVFMLMALYSVFIKNVNFNRTERIPLVFCTVHILSYMFGHAFGKNIIMDTAVISFVIFVITQILLNDLTKLNDVYIIHGKKNDFPSYQLKRVNTFIITTTIIIIFAVMLIFYRGEYGAVTDILLAGMKGAGKFFAAAILAIIRLFSGNGSSVEMEETTTSTESDVLDKLDDAADYSKILEAAAEAIGIIIFLALIAFIIYSVYKYAQKFNKSFKAGKKENDIIEKVDKKKQLKQHKKVMQKEKSASANDSIRKNYKKAILSGVKKKNKIKEGKLYKPDITKTPTQLTKTIIKEDKDADEITKMYELARYSGKELSNDEASYFKNKITKVQKNK